MNSLFGKIQANVLLIESGRTTLFRCKGNELILVKRFRAIEPDFIAFEEYVRASDKNPYVIVTDFIEEDFRIETLAHVTGADRVALLERKLAHSFRTTQYRIARVIGREKEGRKDDRVLFTALTKPDHVDPWIGRILKYKRAITALTSAAYMMELFAKSQKLSGDEHLLIVNLESGSGLRQTYLQKGRVIFSRLTSLVTSGEADLPSLITQQCDQTRKYLERIKQLPYDAHLDVYIVVADDQMELGQETPDPHLMTLQYASVEEIASGYHIDAEGEPVGALAFAIVHSLSHKLLINVYASFQLLRYSFIAKISRGMYWTSALIGLVAVAFSSPMLANAVSKWALESETVAQTEPLLQEYEVLRQRFPETPIQSIRMELLVETYERVAAQVYNPGMALELISQALSRAPQLTIDRIIWQLQPRSTEEEAPTTANQNAGIREAQFQTATIAGETTLSFSLRGQVESAISHRDAREQILAFMEGLTQDAQFEVVPISMPVDVRPDASVVASLNDELFRAAFELQVVQVVQQEVQVENGE